MTSTNSISPTPRTVAGTSGAVDLQTQLARFEHQLSDCVNCASAKTPEGKAAIEAIQNKIRQVKLRLDDAPAAKSRSAFATGAANGNAAPDGTGRSSSGSNGANARDGARTAPVISTVGSIIDVYG